MMKRDVITCLFLLCFPISLFSQAKYTKAPFDGQEAWLREISPEEMAKDPLVINQDWMKRDSLTYLRFKDQTTVVFYGTDIMPNWITRFENLTSLCSMPSAQIKSIPQNIGRLKQLEDFVLLESKVSSIPSSFKDLTNLKHLNLVGDGKCIMPEDIKHLKNLESVFLADFGKIPNAIFELPNLKRLFLYRCNVKSIPSSVKKLKHLEELNLEENPIKEIPEEIFELPSLINFKVNNDVLKSEVAKNKLDQQLSGNQGLHRERLRRLQDVERRKIFDKMREQQALKEMQEGNRIKSFDL